MPESVPLTVGSRCYWRIADRGGYRAGEGGYSRWTPVVVRKVGPKRLYIEGRKKQGGQWCSAFRWVTRDSLRPRTHPYTPLGEEACGCHDQEHADVPQYDYDTGAVY